jgi:hypothetical protein
MVRRGALGRRKGGLGRREHYCEIKKKLIKRNNEKENRS